MKPSSTLLCFTDKDSGLLGCYTVRFPHVLKELDVQVTVHRDKFL